MEETAAKLPDIVNWDDTKATLVGFRKNNINILQCVDEITVSFYTRATSGRSGKISYEIYSSETESHFQVESIVSSYFYALV